MYYVYVIKSKKSRKLYIGTTHNVTRRVQEHNKGLNKSTKPYIPWFLVYIEGYISEKDALKREKNLKYFGKAYSQLKQRMGYSLQMLDKVRG